VLLSEIRMARIVDAIADAVCDEIPEIRRRILLTDHAALYACAGHDERRLPKPRDPVQIQYTSGTTGFPKGALLHQNGLVRNGINSMVRAGLKLGDAFVHHMPLFHTTGCAVLVLGDLGVGATLLLAPMFDPATVVGVIARKRTNFILGVPTMLVALIEAVEITGADISSIRRIMSGGSIAPPELCRKARAVFGAPIQIVYGQIETSPVLTQAWYEDSEEDMTQTIGQPVAGAELSIRDPATNAVVPIGEQCEICARG
jgi:fatty-acyl-CoA synthase